MPAAGLTKLGSGVLILAGTNTYAGTSTVSNGTLRWDTPPRFRRTRPSRSQAARRPQTASLSQTARFPFPGARSSTERSAGPRSISAEPRRSMPRFSAPTPRCDFRRRNAATVYTAQSYTGATEIDGTLNLLPKTAASTRARCRVPSTRPPIIPVTSISAHDPLRQHYSMVGYEHDLHLQRLHLESGDTNVNWTFRRELRRRRPVEDRTATRCSTTAVGARPPTRPTR
jgi:autotransporter-associated beta strand protein